jgi:predicted ribosome quality control (RQC) complex YloA/Tae2 family protein
VVDSYFNLRALVREWRDDLPGTTIIDAYSQSKNELTLAMTGPDAEWMLRSSVQRPFIFIFRTDRYSKARRNVATLFREAFDRNVVDVRIADRDRMLYLDLEGDYRFQWQLFGARANAFLVDGDGRVVEAFQNDEKYSGEEAPAPRAAPMPESFADFEDRWRPNRNSTRQAIQSAVPLFGRLPAQETVFRAGVETEDPRETTEAERRALFEASQTLIAEFDDPAPVIYGGGQFPDAFALAPMQHLDAEGTESEAFDTVDLAVASFVKRRLAERHFHRLYDPLEKALKDAAEHYRESADRMLEELSNESRADRYERWGHLLMAQQDAVDPGDEEVTLPDLFEDGEPVTIPLDPAKSVVDNAEYYYARARRTRRSREEAEARLDETVERAEKARALHDEITAIDTLDGIKTFQKKRESDIAPFVDRPDADVNTFPFRRFDLGDGFEVWVGKNARQNDELTFHVAQKYDLWLHARGVPGSHTVLHLPNRDAEPGRRRKHIAAAIAAYYSKARGSGLVPVMMTRRKYVRSPKGAAPGAVRVEREDVLLVEPGLPG